MTSPLTLNDVPPEVLMRDVYFRDDFLALHAPRGLECLHRDAFHHAAAELAIPGSERRDLETPWGYGGPVALTAEALAAGLSEWRTVQCGKGRVAEFIRLHPFINPVALWGRLDMLEFNRPTVVVDLKQPDAARWNFYSDSTRNCIRKAQRGLTVRPLAAAEWPLFRELYEAGLQRNDAMEAYFLSDAYYQALLAQPWCRAWVAEDTEGPVGVSCFLHSGTPVAHYHLSGGNARSRKANALYLLLEQAFIHYADTGCRWLHLGGGRSASSNDSLLAFKSKFSPERAHFYIGGMIFDSAAYRDLGGGRTRFLCAGAMAAELPVTADKQAVVSLRPFSVETDLPAFFELRCDPANIISTGYDNPPSWQKLQSWVDRELKTQQRRIFIIEVERQSVGYAYAIRRDQEVETAIGVAQRYTGRGIARKALVRLSLELAKDCNWGPPYAAWIGNHNYASIRAHEAANFRPDPERLVRTVVGVEQRRWILSGTIQEHATKTKR